MSPRLYLAPQLRLRQLLPQARFVHAEEIVFRGFECSPQRCGSEDLLVWLGSDVAEGFPQQLPPPGAVAGVLTPQELPHWKGPQCVVPDVWEALGQVAQAVAGWPAQALQLVGVWGSGLRGAAAQLIHRVLGTAGIATGLVGPASADEDHLPCSPRSGSFCSPQMAQWLARIRQSGCTHAVVQVPGSQPPQRALAGLELDVLCITGAANRLAQAQQLLQFLRPEGVLVVAAEEPAARKLLDSWDGPALTVGLGTQWEVGATVLEEHPGEQTFLIHAGWESIPVRTRWLGADYVRACLLATAVGLVHQFRLPAIARGLESLDGIPGCMEAVCLGQQFPVLLFWPEAARCPSVIRSWRKVTAGRMHRIRWQPQAAWELLSDAGEDPPAVLSWGGLREIRRTAQCWDELAAALDQVEAGDLAVIELPEDLSPQQLARLRECLQTWLLHSPGQRLAA